MGGTFNPVHLGHLRAAEEVRERFALDRVLFVPSATPPHKQSGEVAPAEARLEMVRLAVEGNPRFAASDLELRRGGPSYTVDTLEELRRGLGPGEELYFIVGSEAFAEVGSWRETPRLLRQAHFIVTLWGARGRGRVLERLRATVEPLEAGLRFDPEGEDSIRVSCSPHRIWLARVTGLEVSSTSIRERLREGRSVRYLLPPSVEAYIMKFRLYGAPPAEASGATPKGR